MQSDLNVNRYGYKMTGLHRYFTDISPLADTLYQLGKQEWLYHGG